MKRTILFLTVLAVAVVASAQLLWKVEGNGAAHPSYVLGTHHLAPPELLDSISGLNDALNASKHFYGELDMKNVNPLTLQNQALQKIGMPADTTWQQILPADAIAKIDSFFVAQGVPAAQVAQLHSLKPAFIGTQIPLILTIKNLKGFDPQRQFDNEVHKKAMQRGMTSAGFETNEFQINMLYGAPLQVQAEELVENLNNDSIVADVKTMTDLYVAQDFDGIGRFIERNRESPVARRAAERLVYARNEDWAEKLKTILPEGEVFIAVGAGHLPGERGLLNLLRRQGYTVTPVK